MTDALSTVLDLLDLQVAASARFEAAGQWGLSFPQPGQLKVIAVLDGRCWLTPAGGQPISLAAGDCVLLAGDLPFSVTSDPEQDALPQPIVLPSPWPPSIYYQTEPGTHDPDRTVLVSGRFTLDPYAAGLLLDGLPPAMHIDSATAPARGLAPVLRMLSTEATDPQAPGSLTLRRQLTHVLVVHAIRAMLANKPDLPPGWLNALADPQIGAALALIHDQPQHHWSVAELAHTVAMSRSAFASRFRELVGTPPLGYLTTWRMQQAAHALRGNDDTVAHIGAAVGYPVETTFNSTFKRIMGQAPGRYRHTTRTQLANV